MKKAMTMFFWAVSFFYVSASMADTSGLAVEQVGTLSATGRDVHDRQYFKSSKLLLWI